jgi:magnesium-transporting ATPase (P-type)
MNSWHILESIDVIKHLKTNLADGLSQVEVDRRLQDSGPNKPLLAAITLTISLQMLVIYTPIFQPIFKTEALSIENLMISLGLSSLPFWAIEIEKQFHR